MDKPGGTGGTGGTGLNELGAAELATSIAAGEISSAEATQACLDRVLAVDEAVHAFLRVDTEGALAAARDVDRRRAAGEPLGPLAGVPLALKDVLTQAGAKTRSRCERSPPKCAPPNVIHPMRLRAAAEPT